MVALAGAAGCGKSTAAEAFMDLGYVRLPLAGPLKTMLREGLGLTAIDTDGARKETPIPMYDGVTPRRLMQTLGTEWGRAIHPEFWLRTWLATATREAILGRVPGIIVDDCRFENEAAFLQERAGARVIFVRASSGASLGAAEAQHASEMELELVARRANAVVVNPKISVQSFQEEVLRAA